MIDLDWRSDFSMLLLLAALVVLAVLFRRLPRFLASRRARLLVARWLQPVTELAVAGVVAIWVIMAATKGPGTERLLVGGPLVLLLLWAFRGVLRDFASGIVLRMDGLIEAGSWIHAAGVEGRVRRVGYRSLEIETVAGTRLALPFSHLATAGIERPAEARAARAHTFRIEVPRTRPLDRVLADLSALALLSPWASAVRPAEVRLVAETDANYLLEVTATAIDPAFATRIETTVRRELARLAH